MPLKLLHPRYWFTWLEVVLLRLSVYLPWPILMVLGKGLGKLLYFSLPSRRSVSRINLEIAFPKLSKNEIETLNKEHFISLGQGLFEAGMGWWGSDKKIEKLANIEGLEHLEKSLEKGPVILLGAHFISLEMGARILARIMPLHAVYRPHKNAVIEYLVAKQRSKKYGKAIPKDNIRQIIKSIKTGVPTWYVTDQNYRGKSSILSPFFGVPAPSNPGTSRLAKITKAQIVPCMPVRLYNNKNDKRKGYLLRILPPVENFPSGDNHQDTQRLNAIIEAQILDFPSQYLWTHKRYKHYSSENRDFYKEYLKSKNTSSKSNLNSK